MYPADRQYSKEHVWLIVEGDTATLGITEFAQTELGDIVFVELPDVGNEFQAGDVLGTIESVKAVSEIYAPVSGSIVESNAALEEKPETVNSDPHGDGWYCKIKLANTSELEALMDGDAYQKLTSS